MASSSIALNVFRDDLMHCVQRLPQLWQDALNTPNAQAALARLHRFLAAQLAAGAEIYPASPFRALQTLNPDTVKVIILGQDPYHGANQAQGLAFSVPDICRCPPSLRNIFKELALEYPDVYTPQTHELSRWAEQGVLLLNTVLTVQSGLPASHAKKGWETITDEIITRVASAPQPKVFMLWGAHAQSKQVLIPTGPGKPPSLILTSNHPSPLSAQRPPKPFIGCGHFVQANAWLKEHGVSGINWLEGKTPQLF